MTKINIEIENVYKSRVLNEIILKQADQYIQRDMFTNNQDKFD